MMLSLQSITLADLLLSRLLFVDEQGMTTSNLKAAVKTIAGSELSNSAFTERVETALDELSNQDYIYSFSRSRYRITDTGRQRILHHLRIETLPTKLQWNTLKNTYWVAHALKLPELSTNTRKHLSNADGLRAAILKNGFNLPVKDFGTLIQARNALLWQKICDPQTAENIQAQLPDLYKQSFNQGAVMSLMLNDLLQTSKLLPWKKALPQLVAKVANAKRTDSYELRTAILRQALVDSVIPDIATDSTLSNEEFAEITLKAAKDTKDGRIGDHKVFISQVWETFKEHHPNLSISLEEFKQRLVTANQQQLLTLSRDDSPHDLDSIDVGASEIIYLNATFHLIRID